MFPSLFTCSSSFSPSTVEALTLNDDLLNTDFDVVDDEDDDDDAFVIDTILIEEDEEQEDEEQDAHPPEKDEEVEDVARALLRPRGLWFTVFVAGTPPLGKENKEKLLVIVVVVVVKK